MAYTGNGTIDNPYLVNNPDDFKYLLELYQAGSMYIKLTSDINFDDSSNINYSLGEGPTIIVNSVNKYIDGQGYSIYNLTRSNKTNATIRQFQDYSETSIILEFRNIHFKNIFKCGNTTTNVPDGYITPNSSAFLSIDGINGGATRTVLFIGCTLDIVAQNDNCILTWMSNYGRGNAIVKFYKSTINFINYHRHGPIVLESQCGMHSYLIEIIDSHINISGTIRNIPNTSNGTYYYGLIIGNMKFIRCSIEINVKLYYVMGVNVTNYILLLGATTMTTPLLFESSSISINIININELLSMTNVFKVNISTTGGPTIIINNNLLNITSLFPSNTPNLYIIGPDDVNDTYLTNIGFKPPTI
jgi:hypothetical protein